MFPSPRRRTAARLPLLIALCAIGCHGAPRSDSAEEPTRVSNPPPPVETLDAEAIRRNLESFDYVWTTIRDKHWDPELAGNDWDALREKFRPRVESARSQGEALEAMNGLIAALGQSHFGVFPEEVTAAIEGDETGPSVDPGPTATGNGGTTSGSGTSGSDTTGRATRVRPERPRRNRDGFGSIGFDFRVIEDRVVVVRVDDDSPAARTGIRLGWIIDSVDGRSLSEVIEQFRGAADAPGELGLMLGYSIRKRMAGDPGDEIDLVVLDDQDEERPIQLTLDPPRGALAEVGHMPAMRVEWLNKVLSGNVAYFRLSAFLEPVAVMPAIRSFIIDHLDASGFILDLRGNPGGLGIMSNGISGLFVEESGKRLGTMYLREGEIHFSIFPQAFIFTGPLAILIDGGSASTAEIMASGLRDLGRARLFGMKTAGAALPSVFERLPNGAGFQYAIANYISVGGDTLEGDGVAPDVEVPLDRATLLRGDDPVIDAATRWIADQS